MTDLGARLSARIGIAFALSGYSAFRTSHNHAVGLVAGGKNASAIYEAGVTAVRQGHATGGGGPTKRARPTLLASLPQ